MTSSVQPPVLNPPLGTPSSEWAKKTTSSLDPSSQGTSQNTTSGRDTNQSPSVTPGNELPGAFPNRGQGETSAGATTNITETVVDTARYYLPASVVNKVETFLGGNGDSTGATGTGKKVRASEHDVYHQTSLPSQELRGTLPREHVSGVGSLPGASIERSVALLPDEQEEWAEWDTFAGRNTPGYQTPSYLRGNSTGPTKSITQKATNLGVAPGVVKADVPPKQADEVIGKIDPENFTSGEVSSAQQAVRNFKPVTFDIKPAHDVSMPSTETQGQQPGEHTGGVGSLPGPSEEQGVAVLPEEQATKNTEMVRPEHREELGDIPDETKRSTGSRGVGVGDATDPLKESTKSRTQDLPKDTVSFEPETTVSEPGQPSSTSNEPEDLAGIKRSGGSEGSVDGQRKASLKEKIAGGMKVVSGKLGHDKSKVEEGKKLMHGQAA